MSDEEKEQYITYQHIAYQLQTKTLGELWCIGAKQFVMN